MYCESCSEPIEMEGVVRRQNRILRRIVSSLRKRVKKEGELSDSLFATLCESNPAAALALRRLWEEGGFQPPCGPEDYDEIVDVSIRALKAYREMAQGPTKSEVETGQ